MEKIYIKEIQKRLLSLAKVVNDICERHDIPLYMVGGTMLGAIRHKGFIPWDDDMDFAVTYDHYKKLQDILRSELPEPYRCATFEDTRAVLSFFFKVEDTSTVIDDIRVPLPLEKQLGLNIDIFPLVSCSEKDWKLSLPKIHKLYMRERRIFIGSTERQFYKKIAKAFLRRIMPFDYKYYLRRIGEEIERMEPGEIYCNAVSPHYWNIPIPRSYLEMLVKYPFEDTEFYGISDYDAYLKLLYKDYMKLPPKEKQEVHADNVYVK